MKRKQNVHNYICEDVNWKDRSLERKKGIIYLQCVKLLHVVISENYRKGIFRDSIVFINNILFVHLDGHNVECFGDFIRKIGNGTKANSTCV